MDVLYEDGSVCNKGVWGGTGVRLVGNPESIAHTCIDVLYEGGSVCNKGVWGGTGVKLVGKGELDAICIMGDIGEGDIIPPPGIGVPGCEFTWIDTYIVS